MKLACLLPGLLVIAINVHSQDATTDQGTVEDYIKSLQKGDADAITRAVTNAFPKVDRLEIGKALRQNNQSGNGIPDLLSHFGAGISLTYDMGSRDRVKRAVVDANNIIRVEDDDNAQIRFSLEAHQLFTLVKEGGEQKVKSLTNTEQSIGLGPFVALHMGGDDVVDAIGLGLMLGFRREDPDDAGAVNIGIGWMIDPNVQVLGDGLEAGKPLPAGDTLRFKETVQHGLLVMVSFGF